MLSRVRISFLLVAAIAAACSDSTSPSPPVQPMIATGGAHTCRLASTGSASCWGDNSSGELGDGSTTSSVTPVPVSGGIAFTTIAAGGSYTCGLDRDGAAYCWGTNIGGELGNGTTVQNASVPGPVSGGLSFVGLAAGTNHACALTRDGAAYCWGSNELQELGTGDTVRRLVPTAVSGGLSFSTLAAGGDHTCGIAKSGAAYCWGGNIYGQLGSGSSQNPSGVPLAVSGGLTFTAITAGAGHTCAISSSGTAYCWGANSDGQAGNLALS